MSEKIIGYNLLIFGILTILLSGWSVYSVFTNKSRPVEIFNFGSVSLDLGKVLEGNPELKGQKPELKQELIQSDLINKPLNISAHLFLMGFIASAGFKIASLGVMLIRPIVVKLKESIG